MLASDDEREATVLRLRAAHLEGRLDTDELEARIGRAHAARTRAELDALGTDLTSTPATTAGVPRLPGRRHFEERKLLALDAAAARERVRGLVPSRLGFYLHSEDGETLRFENRVRVGSRVHVRLRGAGPGRTLVDVTGNAPLSVRRAFALLSD